MPDTDWNKSIWGNAYDWSGQGEEWSTTWGGSEAQWFGSLLPRIRSFVPCRSILEIAPGFGRWTRFLVGLCQTFTGVDISDVAIEKAKRRTEENGRAHKCRFLQSDIATYEPAQKFDVILFRDSIYYLDPSGIGAILERYGQWLNPGGVFIVKIWNGNGKHSRIVRLVKNNFEVVEEHWPQQSNAAVLVFKGRCVVRSGANGRPYRRAA